MQEQNKRKWVHLISQANKMHLVWAGLCGFLFLATLVSGLFIYRHLPTCEWRESHSAYPWYGRGIAIGGISAHWQSSKGHERMELRAAYYPVATIELKQHPSPGSGYLHVRIVDESGGQNGERVLLPYQNGEFVTVAEPNVQAQGKTVTFHTESGFASRSEFLRHALAEETKLWRVCVWNQADGADEIEFMGYATIPATDQQP